MSTTLREIEEELRYLILASCHLFEYEFQNSGYYMYTEQVLI